MGWSLNITRPDGSVEDLRLSSLYSFEQYWMPPARRLGLELIPMLPAFFRVTLTNLDPLLAEFAAFRAECVRINRGDESAVELVDRLIETLERLKGESGWEAYFG